jgi:hypothetical protein
MTELLTVLIGLTWILALVGVPVAILSIVVNGGSADVPVFTAVVSITWALIGLAWLCYRVGLTVRPWLVEVLR